MIWTILFSTNYLTIVESVFITNKIFYGAHIWEYAIIVIMLLWFSLIIKSVFLFKSPSSLWWHLSSHRHHDYHRYAQPILSSKPVWHAHFAFPLLIQLLCTLASFDSAPVHIPYLTWLWMHIVWLLDCSSVRPDIRTHGISTLTYSRDRFPSSSS